MDKCREFKDLILTDYIDGQLDIAIKKQVDAHLHQCASCQAFATEVKNNVILPFEKATLQEVPDVVWQNIKQEIQQPYVQEEGLLDRVRDWMGALTLPKLVPALCSVVMVVFVGSMFFFNQQTKQAQDKEQVLYLASVLSTDGNTGSNDMGTPIETYFL